MIREAVIDDIEKIVDINIKTWYSTYHNIVNESILKRRLEDKNKRIQLFKHNINNNINKCFVIIDKDIVGYITCGKSDDINYDSEVFSFYVLKEFQNLGYGSKLFNYTKKYLNRNNNNMIVNCFHDNPYKSFYLKDGVLINTKLSIIGNQEILLDTYYYNLKEDIC